MTTSFKGAKAYRRSSEPAKLMSNCPGAPKTPSLLSIPGARRTQNSRVNGPLRSSLVSATASSLPSNASTGRKTAPSSAISDFNSGLSPKVSASFSAMGPSISSLASVLACKAVAMARAPSFEELRPPKTARRRSTSSLGSSERAAAGACGAREAVKAARARSTTVASACVVKPTKRSTSALRKSRSAWRAVLRTATSLACGVNLTRSASSAANWNPPMSAMPRLCDLTSPDNSSLAASVSNGPTFAGSSLVRAARRPSATSARTDGLRSKARRASAQAGTSADWARLRSSSLVGARSSEGRMAARTVAPAFGSNAKVANRRCSAVRPLWGRCRKPATAAG